MATDNTRAALRQTPPWHADGTAAFTNAQITATHALADLHPDVWTMHSGGDSASFTCTENDALIDFLLAFKGRAVATEVMRQHVAMDDDDGDAHIDFTEEQVVEYIDGRIAGLGLDRFL